MIIISLLISTLLGYAGMAQKGALIRAYNNFEDGDDENVLNLTSHAENFQKPSREMKAELIYLRSLALEKLDRNDEAQGLFKYRSKEYNDTQYCDMAQEELEE